MKPTEAAEEVRRILSRTPALYGVKALAMAAEALETPVDGREWISIDDPPEKSGQYLMDPGDSALCYYIDTWTEEGVWYGARRGKIAVAYMTVPDRYRPNTTPLIPEMPQYEWSPTLTPRGAVVKWSAQGVEDSEIVRAWAPDGEVVVQSTLSGKIKRIPPASQSSYPIISIELPEPAPIDPRLVDFVGGARGLLQMRVAAADREVYEIPRGATQAALRLLRAAEKAIEGKQAPDTPEPDEQLSAGIKELVAVIEMADELASQAILTRRTTGHPGDHKLLSIAAEYDVLEIHNVAFAARVKTALGKVTGRSDG